MYRKEVNERSPMRVFEKSMHGGLGRGNVGIVGVLMQRRGIIVGTTEADGFSRVEAEVPLAEMFGFSTVLRSATQGKAEFTMEFSRYLPVPQALADELIKKHREEQLKKEKGK